MTLPQVDLYMISDKIIEGLSKGRDYHRVYFDGTPEEQLEKAKRYKEMKKLSANTPKPWRLS